MTALEREDLQAFREAIEKGSIPRAYRELLSYMTSLRSHFQRKLGDDAVSGIYQGRMDFTFFALFPSTLRERGLKVPILFHYDVFRFEVWLAARNRKIQREHWERVKDGKWPGCRLVAPGPGVDSILERDLAPGSSLANPQALTTKIEKGVTAFVGSIDRFLGGN